MRSLAHTMLLQLIISVLLMSQARPVPINPDKPLDVCTVLQHLKDYRGKIVSIRGRWSGDGIEGDCAAREPQEMNRFSVPYSDNSIVFVHSYDQEADSSPEWNEDPVAVRGATKTYDRLNRQGHNVLGTFIGRLEVLRSDHQGGYGHMGTYRAQLVLVTINDVVSETGKPVRKPPKITSIDR